MFYKPILAAADSRCSLAELVGAFSYALDITEGQPPGHSVRCCWIGHQIAARIGLGEAELGDLHFALLLKDLGCSSNAARICELYQADDLAFKRGYKTIGTSLASTLHFVFSRTATQSSFGQRAAAIGNILLNGTEIANSMILARCTRGSDIARTLGFSDAVCSGIYHLDEHWDGSGRPDGLSGEAIPLASRIALAAQIFDVFRAELGREAAVGEIGRRSGSWLDPSVCDALIACAAHDSFWLGLQSPIIDAHVAALAPAERERAVDDDFLDNIASAFGQVVDAKSPFTAGHSERVADFAVAIGERIDIPATRRRWLHRAALLHDIGKLGVSNSILDKPGKLTDAEWVSMRSHASHTQEILDRVAPLRDIAPVAAAHHERLDGTGYPLGLDEQSIGLETRIITACDFYDALTAERPYRGAMPAATALAIMRDEVGRAVDPRCFDALRDLVAGG